MKLKAFIIIIVFSICQNAFAQPCGVAQNLSAPQESQINTVIILLDSALKNEDLFQIDSLSYELKSLFSSEGGLPGETETYYTLVSNNSWLDFAEAIQLSSLLIAADSAIYADLWMMSLGMKPPLYQPNSIFLRASAEIASGLLKIAHYETDTLKKALYQNWATKALDSLATMQLPNGAFPFPDLREYNDPVFSVIIQNFIDWCGPDSVNVLQDGWIIDDKGTGEFKFDAGVIANAYFEAYLYTGNEVYKNIAVATGDYLQTLSFNLNYNYNTFASLGLTRAFQLTNDSTYLDRAIITLRYSLYPGQANNGRWVDGHNALSRYHSIIIQNTTPTIQLLDPTNIFNSELETMAYMAVKNMVDYSSSCNSATGFRWLLKAYGLHSSIISQSLKDSISDQIGQHITQAALNGKYLDVPTMGEYLCLLENISVINYHPISTDISITIFPNPAHETLTIQFSEQLQYTEELQIFNAAGNLMIQTPAGNQTISVDVSSWPNGIYFVKAKQMKQTRSFVKY